MLGTYGILTGDAPRSMFPPDPRPILLGILAAVMITVAILAVLW